MTSRELRPVGDTQVLGSVSNAARLLKEFGRSDHELGVSELARRLGLGKSTTHRLLHTLTMERLVEQSPTSGHYRLADTMRELGGAVRQAADLHAAAAPVLEQLGVLVGPAALRAELMVVGDQGWAKNMSETGIGIVSVAAPIRNRDGRVVAAVSLTGPAERLEGLALRRYVRPVTEAAAAISRRMGWAEAEPRQEGTR